MSELKPGGWNEDDKKLSVEQEGEIRKLHLFLLNCFLGKPGKNYIDHFPDFIFNLNYKIFYPGSSTESVVVSREKYDEVYRAVFELERYLKEKKDLADPREFSEIVRKIALVVTSAN